MKQENNTLLFLDDEQHRYDEAVEKYGDRYDILWVKTARDAINSLETRKFFDVVSLDHDLQYDDLPHGTKSGLDVARYIIKNKGCCTIVVVHSLNPVRADMMMVELHGAGLHALRLPAKDIG